MGRGQTDGLTSDGHCDLETELAQWADSVKRNGLKQVLLSALEELQKVWGIKILCIYILYSSPVNEIIELILL